MQVPSRICERAHRNWLPGAEGSPPCGGLLPACGAVQGRAGSPTLPLLQAWKPGSLQNRCQAPAARRAQPRPHRRSKQRHAAAATATAAPCERHHQHRSGCHRRKQRRHAQLRAALRCALRWPVALVHLCAAVFGLEPAALIPANQAEKRNGPPRENTSFRGTCKQGQKLLEIRPPSVDAAWQRERPWPWRAGGTPSGRS